MSVTIDGLGNKIGEIKANRESLLVSILPGCLIALACFGYLGYQMSRYRSLNNWLPFVIFGVGGLLYSLICLRHLRDRIELYEKGFVFQVPSKYKGRAFLLEQMSDVSSSRTHSGNNLTHWADVNRMNFTYGGEKIQLSSQYMQDMHFQFQKAYGRNSYSASAGLEEEGDIRKDKTGSLFQATLKKMALDVLQGEIGLTVAYGYHDSSSRSGNTTHTSFYHYAVAWNSETCWLIPFSFAGAELFPNRPLTYHKDRLGRIVTSEYGKNGLQVTFQGPDGGHYATFRVCPAFAKGDSRPVNVAQGEESARFRTLMEAWSVQVNQAHPELAEKPKPKYGFWSPKNSLWFGLAGMVTSYFTMGISGILCGAMGIVVYCVGRKKFGKESVVGAMCVLGIALSALSLICGVFAMLPLLMPLFQGARQVHRAGR